MDGLVPDGVSSPNGSRRTRQGFERHGRMECAERRSSSSVLGPEISGPARHARAALKGLAQCRGIDQDGRSRSPGSG
jgi:hypothetical protein